MFKGKKKSIILTSCMLITLALTSCNNRNFDEVDDLVFDEYGDPVFNDVELDVLSIIGDPDNVYLDKVNTMFNDYYRENGLTAKITSVSNSDFYTQLANTINTDPENAPDVIIIHSERLNKLAHDNIIIPMDEYFDVLQNNTFSPTNYYTNVINECYYNNELYGVPLDIHAGVFYYRADILEKNGIPIPTDLNSFVVCCNQLIKKYNEGTLFTRAMDRNNPSNTEWTLTRDFGDEYSPVVLSYSGGIEQGWIPQTAVFQNGGSLTDDKGYPAWDTEGLTKTMQMLRDWQTGENNLYDENNNSLFEYEGKFVASDNDYNTVWSKLASGEAVFSMEGPWWSEQRLDEYESVLGGLEDIDGNTYKPLGILNLSNLFAFDNEQSYADDIYGVGHCFAICRTVTSKTTRVAASLYAQFMSENAIDYLEGGHLPAFKAISDSNQYLEKDYYDRYLKYYGDEENFRMLGNTPYYSEVYDQLKLVYQDIFTASKNSIPVEELINTRYQEALQLISSLEDL